MTFIVAETGEERKVYSEIVNGVDSSKDIAIACGLFRDDSVVYENEAGDIVAPLKDVEYWSEFFERLEKVGNGLDSLKNKYNEDEVMGVYCSKIKGRSELDDWKSAFEAIQSILQKRYNPETARFMGSHILTCPKTTSDTMKKTSTSRIQASSSWLTKEGQ